IDALLLHTYGSTIKARRTHLKKAHEIHRQGPNILDEQLQCVQFPTTVSRQKNQFLVNLYHFLRFTPEPSPATSVIHFSDGTQVDVHADFAFCEKQYSKALVVNDRLIKIKEHNAMYAIRRGCT